MRAFLEGFDLVGLLVPDPRVDHILCEDVATQQEVVIVPQRLQRFLQRGRDCGEVVQFLRAEIVDVLVERADRGRACSGCRRVPPSAQPTLPGKGCTSDPGQRNSNRLLAGTGVVDRDADRGRSVPKTVRQIDRGFEARRRAACSCWWSDSRTRTGPGRVCRMPAHRVDRQVAQARRSRSRRTAVSPFFHSEKCRCRPEPLSFQSGLGMKVAVLPCRAATFLTMYL